MQTMFGTMTVRRKLMAGFLGVAVLAGVVGGIGWWNAGQIRGQLPQSDPERGGGPGEIEPRGSDAHAGPPQRVSAHARAGTPRRGPS